MEFLITALVIFAFVPAILFGSFMGLNSANAQNMTVPSNMTASGNMTAGNMTLSESSSGSAKMHLEEGIKALKLGDNQAAKAHLDIAKQMMGNSPSEAIKHFDEGMQALNAGDSQGAIMHLDLADKALG